MLAKNLHLLDSRQGLILVYSAAAPFNMFLLRGFFEEIPQDLFDAAVYSYGINYLGLPAGVIPIDLVDDLPAGVQIVGRRFREDVILEAMAAVERRAGRLVDRLWRRV